MTSISSINSATSTASTTTQLSTTTKQKLEALGLDSTEYTTESEAQAAITQTQADQDTGSSTDSGSSSDSNSGVKPSAPTWASLMDSNGISLTGSQDGDVVAVEAALASMDSQEAKSLASSFQNAGLSVTETESEENEQDMFAGQAQLAEMNKSFL